MAKLQRPAQSLHEVALESGPTQSAARSAWTTYPFLLYPRVCIRRVRHTSATYAKVAGASISACMSRVARRWYRVRTLGVAKRWLRRICGSWWGRQCMISECPISTSAEIVGKHLSRADSAPLWSDISRRSPSPSCALSRTIALALTPAASMATCTTHRPPGTSFLAPSAVPGTAPPAKSRSTKARLVLSMLGVKPRSIPRQSYTWRRTLSDALDALCTSTRLVAAIT